MPIRRIVVGVPAEEVYHPGALKAAFAELVSTFIFVFAGQGSGVAYSKLTGNGPATPEGLIAAALAHAFGLFVAVSISFNISGGHVNPAVTFGLVLGGKLSLLRGLLYWVGQLLGSVLAVLVLKISTGGLDTGHFSLSGISAWEGVLLEITLTFGLVYTVYATAVDPNRGGLATIAPIAIGFIVGANIFIGGAFSGAAMNPAVAFGPAVVSWKWGSQWVYWLGPLVGGGIAGLLYDLVFIADEPPQGYVAVVEEANI